MTPVEPAQVRVEIRGDKIALHIRSCEETIGTVVLSPEHAWKIGQDLACAAVGPVNHFVHA